MKAYEVIEIISTKTKSFGMMFFNSNKELSEYLRNKREWNSWNNNYSIVAWDISRMEAYRNLNTYGYKETWA